MYVRHSYLLLAVAGFALGCGSKPKPPVSAAPSTPAKKAVSWLEHDKQAIQGTWHVVAIEAAGEPVAEAKVQKLGLEYIFNDRQMTVHRPDRPDSTGNFTFQDDSPYRKLVVLTKPSIRAFYELDGDTLRLCVLVDPLVVDMGQSRMKSSKSPKTDLVTLKRKSKS